MIHERHQLVSSHTPPTRDLACNLGMCPDWESNWQTFDLQAAAQSTEPHQPGLILHFKKLFIEFIGVALVDKII